MSQANSKDNLPSVSVIVPAHNGSRYIRQLIESVLRQDYPKELVEIIIVDNNSSDQTKGIVSEYPVTLLEENDVQSSYAARNKGVLHAKGKILAFIDSDCTASMRWMAEGVKTLESSAADLVGGKVKFVLSADRTVAEMYDSITHMQVERGIERHNAAPTANLFVRASVFDDVGLFPEDVKSGADFQWTSRASGQGFTLAYSPSAVVEHPARMLKTLLTKRFRTGLGLVKYWRGTGVSWWEIAVMTARRFLPRRLSMIKKAIDERGTSDMKKKIWAIFLVAYLCNLVTAISVLASICGFGKDSDAK